jgi:hypothetical protein
MADRNEIRKSFDHWRGHRINKSLQVIGKLGDLDLRTNDYLRKLFDEAGICPQTPTISVQMILT